MEQGYITLSECVNAYLVRRGETSSHHFAKYLGITIDGLADLNYDVGGQQSVKTVELPIDPATNSIPFPQDMVNYTKVGTCVNGNVIMLGINTSMCPIPPTNDCGTPEAMAGGFLNGQLNNPVDGTPAEAPYGGYTFYNAGNYGTQFGHGGGYSFAYYRPNWENRRFYFTHPFGFSEILLEYISNGYKPGEITLVHAFMKEPLIAWMGWMDVEYNRNANMGEKDQRAKRYALAKRQLGHRNRSWTYYEFLQQSRIPQMLAPRL